MQAPTLTGRNFLVGISEIDEEHQQLFDCLDRLISAVGGKFESSQAFDALEKLSEYTRTHFRVEECLMRLFLYPGLEAHQKQHATFIEEIENLRSRIISEDISTQMIGFLLDWLINHIQKVDTIYAKYIEDFVAEGRELSTDPV
ncbi:MAG: hypothetical protein RIR18_70 [Pseudomonadota bacterium]|jgi:hemerythrin